jgi:hypothetical protein
MVLGLQQRGRLVAITAAGQDGDVDIMPIAEISCRDWRRIACVLVLFAATSNAAERPVSDQVTLRSGLKLRGVLFEQSDKSLTLLVSAKSLSGTNAKFHQTSRQQNLEAHQAGLEQTIQRLRAEQPRAGDAAVAAFLTQQREDTEAELAKADNFDPPFLWLTLTSKEIARVEPASAEHRPLLAWAWMEHLDRAETLSADELTRALKARNVSPIGWPLPFIEQLPVREQSDDEWAVRRALIEYAIGQPLEFQGTGDVLARAGSERAQADVGQLLVELLRSQLQAQLGDLLGDGKPARNAAADNDARKESLRKAIQTAELENRSGFRVTRLDLAGDFQQATVTTQFVARLADGSWRTVFQHAERADAKQARPDIEKRIQEDPQVKQVLELTRQLGLTAEGQIQQALRFGAATMTAQQAANGQFAAFRDIYSASLLRPPLAVQPDKSRR